MTAFDFFVHWILNLVKTATVNIQRRGDRTARQTPIVYNKDTFYIIIFQRTNTFD